eukprot:PhM_4_TR4696/c0_g1_i1/m.28481
MTTIITNDYLDIQFRDPVSGSCSQRRVEERTFALYRNMGHALVCVNPTDGGNPKHPVVLETYSHLRAYHTKPTNQYSLEMRKTFNIPTYEVALGVIHDPQEPFYDTKELQYTKPLKLMIARGERDTLFPDFNRDAAHKRFQALPNAAITIDGVMQNDKASALFTSFPAYDSYKVGRFFQEGLFLHYFQRKSSDMQQVKYWRQFFSRPVHLYVGFAHPLTDSQRAEAQSLNIRCLVRNGFRYSVLR